MIRAFAHWVRHRRILNLAAIFSLLGLSLLVSNPAQAHKASDSYLKLTGGSGKLALQWDIAIKDLELLIGVDADQNGDVTWGELKAKQSEIVAHAISHLKITADGQACRLTLSELRFTRHSDGGYAVLILDTGASGSTQDLSIDYQFLFEVDPTHRGLVFYQNETASRLHVMSPTNSTLTFNTGEIDWTSTLFEFIREGVWHIWIGFDHILFLLALLLPAVLVREQNEWVPVDQFRPALKNVLKIVTVFTIAHSITLWLAAMEYFTLPSQAIESAIAFSIISTAVNNLYPILNLRSWIIAFVFGLIHGFGFANVLVDLGLSDVSLAMSLFGFNVGVELGQLAIVAVFLPLAFYFRLSEYYELLVLKLGSVLVGAIALIWFIERVGNVEIIGF